MRAGQFDLQELGTCEDVITQLSGGSLTTPNGSFHFPGDQEDKHAAYSIPFHSEGLAANNRLSVLTITGASPHVYINQPMLDWELKASPIPFDSLAELMTEYGLGQLRTDVVSIDVIAEPPVFVHSSSEVLQNTAKIVVYLPKGLLTEKTQLGYRIVGSGVVTKRASVLGESLVWREEDEHFLGTTEIEVPDNAVAQCIACYSGIALHHLYIGDFTKP